MTLRPLLGRATRRPARVAGAPSARGGGAGRGEVGSAGEHDVEAALGEGDAAAGAVGGPALGLLAQHGLDRVERRGHVEEAFDLGLGQEQGHESVPLFVGVGSARISGLMRVLVIDNYDSFTYNLVQYLGELGAEVLVRRNDEVTPEEVAELRPDRIVVSPGPCTPNEAGISVELIEKTAGNTPLLGVCLGHQSIGQAFGARIVRGEAVHGKTA